VTTPPPDHTQAANTTERRARVVVVGGGFGGVQAVKRLARANVDVTLIDRNNYHLFQPLNYQVATGSLSAGEIAIPLRQIFRREPSVHVLMGEVVDVDLERRNVSVDPAGMGASVFTVPYDTLLVASGAKYAYFGHEDWRSLALEVKTLDGALTVRGRVLKAFEAAELETDPEVQADLLTFVVVGAGPTGVEMAGQIAELACRTLPAEFRRSDPRAGRVLLVEMATGVLPGFSPRLSDRARSSLERLGVTPLLSHTITDVQPDSVEIQAPDGTATRIPTRTVVWAAGIEGSSLARALAEASGAELDRAGRVTVEANLALPGHPEVLAFGDMVRVRDPHSGEARLLPGIAPVAMQQGRYAAGLVADRLAGLHTAPFRYRDKGTLATIGRARAVADIRGLRVSGFPAWLTWLMVHLFYLIGFQNRVLVLLRWMYSFSTQRRGTRLITGAGTSPGASVRRAHDHPHLR
jgi:NADH dehydrogenase